MTPDEKLAMLKPLLFAIAERYKPVAWGENDRYIICPNPDYREPDGTPYLTIDLQDIYGGWEDEE